MLNKSIPGRRIDGKLPEYPGDYGVYNGQWFAKAPSPGFLASQLDKGDVILHMNRTITVSSLIRVRNSAGGLWEGYLEGGIWREA
jgi:hypothetical protein